MGAMTALKDVAGPRSFLLAGNSKLVSYGDLQVTIAAGVEFIAPTSKQYVGAAEPAGLDTDAVGLVDYTAQRDVGKAADRSRASRVFRPAPSPQPVSTAAGSRYPLRQTGRGHRSAVVLHTVTAWANDRPVPIRRQRDTGPGNGRPPLHVVGRKPLCLSVLAEHAQPRFEKRRHPQIVENTRG
jgi:hypothetical protein